MKRGTRQHRVTDKGFSEHQVLAALRDRFKAPAWAFLKHVRNTTGFTRSIRTADALAMSLWPSRGLELNGFEVKVHRSDWLRELNQPDKAEEIAQYCDRWWIAAASKDLVKPGELPPNWGLLVMQGTRLVVVTEAPKLEAKPLTRHFLASILRYAVAESGVSNEIEVAQGRSYQRGYEAGKKSQEDAATRAVDARQALEQRVRQFEQAAGIRLDSYPRENVRLGEAVRYVLRGGHKDEREELERLRSTAAMIYHRIDSHLQYALSDNEDSRERLNGSIGA